MLSLLLWRWLPLAIKERHRADQRVGDLETLATMDFLTGLSNRRHFETVAHTELSRSQRYMRPFSILMLDIDHFKDVNDRLGHAAGDLILKNVAEICRQGKRSSDFIARVGGEEFALILPETTFGDAHELAERLRRLVEESKQLIDGQWVRVTVSIGVAGAGPSTSGLGALQRSADEALYEAKRLGRNQVAIAQNPNHPTWLRTAAG